VEKVVGDPKHSRVDTLTAGLTVLVHLGLNLSGSDTTDNPVILLDAVDLACESEFVATTHLC